MLYAIRPVLLLAVLLLGGCEGSSHTADTGGTTLEGEIVASLSDGGGETAATNAAAVTCRDLPSFNGKATFYDATGSGTCLLGELQPTAMIAALNESDFDRAAWCGACAHVTGPKGSVVVKIVDMCPTCGAGDLDLSPAAFAKIADNSDGVAAIDWEFVACDVSDAIQLRFKDGSNPYWTALQLRNHRYPISQVEYLDHNNQYQSLTREPYNFFIEWSGAGEPPYTFRVTDYHGQTLVRAATPLVEDTDISGGAQFPVCVP